MHPGNSENTNQLMARMICDSFRWTCAASVIRSEAAKTSAALASQEGPASAPFVQDATLARSGDEIDSRDHRLQTPPREDCERAIVSSTADQLIANQTARAIWSRWRRRNTTMRRTLRRMPTVRWSGHRYHVATDYAAQTTTPREVCLWMAHFPSGRWVTNSKRDTPDWHSTIISNVCIFLLCHDKSISYGSDGGVAMSVVHSEVRIGAGGNARRPYPTSGSDLIEMSVWGSDNLRFQTYHADDSGPLALGSIRGHSSTAAGPMRMSWEHRLLPSQAIGSARSYIFFSATLDKNPVTRRKDGIQYSDKNGNVEPDNSDNDKLTLFEAYKFDIEAVVECRDVRLRVLCDRSPLHMCREPVPKAAIIKIRWTEVNTNLAQWRKRRALDASRARRLEGEPEPADSRQTGFVIKQPRWADDRLGGSPAVSDYIAEGTGASH